MSHSPVYLNYHTCPLVRLLKLHGIEIVGPICQAGPMADIATIMQATFTTAATETACIDDGSTKQSFTKHYDIVASIFIRRKNFLRLGNKQYQLERVGKHLQDYEHTSASSIELGVGACCVLARRLSLRSKGSSTKVIVQKMGICLPKRKSFDRS